MGRLLAIDYGLRRTGIAVTDPLRITANPLQTVATEQLMDWLQAYLSKETVDEVVIGHPVQMNGRDSESWQYIQPFIAAFKRRFPLTPIKEFDERFTSTIAHQAMITGGMKRQHRQDRAAVDKLAACIILEDYMTYLTH
ncbi:MAG: Holliday junction resolvase RuvX [Paludibacteraceae bacterium]|nr:Holliday junction resolvase RuvX [Paludibacteraceae bacterium]